MIRIDSVNSAISGRARAEQGLAEYIENQARLFGLEVQRMPVPGQADNLLITCDKGADSPWLLFESHMDTVGTEGMSIEPFSPRVAAGLVHGRGACDTKGSGAAMLWALRTYASVPIGTANVALLLTVDEEVSRSGINAFVGEQLPTLPWRPAGAIVGEPTGLRLVTAHRGAARLAIRTEGVAAHSSDPSRGRSAIRMMMPVLEAIEERYIPSLTATNPLTGPAVCSVNLIRGGSQINIIAQSCEIQIDRRTVPGEEASEVVASVRKLLSELRVADPALNYALRELLMYEPLDPAASEVFARQLGALLESMDLSGEPTGAGYGSHAGTLASAGMPAVVLGPGDIAQAHTADEWLNLDQLERAVAVYLAIMQADISQWPRESVL
jgi:acetylornithine deacetylase